MFFIMQENLDISFEVNIVRESQFFILDRTEEYILGWLMTLPLGHYSQAKPTSHRPEHWKVSMGIRCAQASV